MLFVQSNSHISLKNKLEKKKGSEGNGPLFACATKIRLLAAHNVFEQQSGNTVYRMTSNGFLQSFDVLHIKWCKVHI